MKKHIKLLLFSLSLFLLFVPQTRPKAEVSLDEFVGETVTIGTVGEELADIWEFVADKAAEDGIELDIVLFTDYNTPNISLVDGSLDRKSVV